MTFGKLETATKFLNQLFTKYLKANTLESNG